MIPGAFPILSGGFQKSVVFQEARHSSTAATSFTFTGVNIGTPDPTRLIVVGVNYYEYDTSANLNSLMVGGAATASRVTASEGVPGGSGSFIYANLRTISVATGSTATITATFNRAINLGCSVAVWSIYNLQSSTPVATTSDGVNSGAATISFTTQPEDIICAVLTGAVNGGSSTWTGATEDYDSALGGLTRSGASTQVFTTGTKTITGQNMSGESILVGAQFR